MMTNYPHVTEVLGVFVDFSKVPPEVLEAGQIRGTNTHAYCAKYAQNIWMGKIDPECAGYVLSFQSWFDEWVDEVLVVEEEMFDERYGFTGRPDLILIMRSVGIILVDLKNPLVEQRTWKGQIAAYLHLAKINHPEINIAKGGSLRLHPEGKMAKMKWYENSKNDFGAFLSALFAYKYFIGG